MTDHDGRKQRLNWIGRALISAAILLVAVLFADVSALPRALATIPLPVFLLAFALNLLGSIIVPALQTRIALGASRIRLRVVQLVSINLMVRFFILVLPRPAAVGIRWLAYRDAGQESRGSEAAALMAYERVVQATVITGALVVLLAWEQDQLPGATRALWLAGLCMFVLASSGFLAFSWPPASKLPRWILELRIVPGAIRSRAERLLDSIEGYPGLSAGRKVVILALSLVYFVLFVASFWVLLLGLGVEMNFSAVAWIRSLVFILTLIPVTIAGIGVREAGLVGLLRLYDVPETEALAAAVAALGVQLAIGAIGGIVALVRQLNGGKPQQEAAASPVRPAPE